jgi:nucleoid-associated protein YgaU
MDLTSAAEANLNARVRPQIVALRSKTPYPKRRPEGVAAAVAAGGRPVLSVVGPAAVPGSNARLSVVGGAETGRSVAGRSVPRQPASRWPRSGRPGAGRSDKAARTPIKLTRRGRVVVGVLIGLAVAAVAIAIWFAVAGQAQASSQVGPRVPAGNSVSRVVVRPGDTLWAIAAQANPAADPRAVIPEIIDLNSLSGTSLQVGQILLVPKS